VALTATDRGSGGNNTASTSIAITPASNFTAGKFAILCIAYDNSGSGGSDPFSSISDNHGNTWTLIEASLRDPGAASAGVALRVYRSLQNAATLTTSSTITVSFGANSTGAKAWTLTEVSNSTGSLNYKTGGNSGASGATATPSITTGNIFNGQLVLGVVGREYNATRTDDADTSNGSWSASQNAGFGSTTSGIEIISQWKIVTADGTQTFNPTFGGQSVKPVNSVYPGHLCFGDVCGVGN